MIKTKLTRKQQIDLAVSYFGLYSLGLSNPKEGSIEYVDQTVCMLNFKVPWYIEECNDKQLKILGLA